MKKIPATIAVALAVGLCTAPAARAGHCEIGDPVYDPGSNSPCNFAMAPVTPGAEAYVHGRFMGQFPHVQPPSYLEDTADDGLDAYLWLRTVKAGETRERWVNRASGAGATEDVNSFTWGDLDAFYLRVCVGEGTANCSAWSS